MDIPIKNMTETEKNSLKAQLKCGERKFLEICKPISQKLTCDKVISDREILVTKFIQFLKEI